VHGWPWVLSVQKPGAGKSLALGFEVEQFAGYTVAVDFVAAIGNRCFQLGHAGFVDGRLITQLVLPVSDEELFKRLKSMTMLKTSGNLDACHVLGHSLENFRLTLQ
jgi:hypothetical protein